MGPFKVWPFPFASSPQTLGTPSLLLWPTPCFFCTSRTPPDPHRLPGAHPRRPQPEHPSGPLRRKIQIIFAYSPPRLQTSGPSGCWPTPATSTDERAQHAECIRWRQTVLETCAHSHSVLCLSPQRVGLRDILVDGLVRTTSLRNAHHSREIESAASRTQ